MQENNKIFTEDDLKQLCSYLLIDYDSIISKNRTWTLVFQRIIMINYIRNNYNNSLKSIGKLFGNRDHSTIHVALETYKQELKTPSPLFSRIATELENMLTHYTSYSELKAIKLFINDIFILPQKKIIGIAILPLPFSTRKINEVEDEKIKITYIDNSFEIKTYTSNDKIQIHYIDKLEDNIIIKQHKQIKIYSVIINKSKNILY